MRSDCSRISGHVEGTLVCPRQFPPPVPAGASHGYGKMARQHPTRWIAGQSEQTTGETGISPAGSRHDELPEAAIRGPLVRTYPWRWPGWVRGRGQSRQEPLGSCADFWIHMIIFHQSAHDCCNRPDDRTALADGF